MRSIHSHRVYVASCGVRVGEPDPFVAEVLDEIGVPNPATPRSFDDLDDGFFDLVVSLSPEAQHRAVELTRNDAVEIEYWPTPDPSLERGNRDARIEAYRDLRRRLIERIKQRFPPARGPTL